MPPVRDGWREVPRPTAPTARELHPPSPFCDHIDQVAQLRSRFPRPEPPVSATPERAPMSRTQLCVASMILVYGAAIRPPHSVMADVGHALADMPMFGCLLHPWVDRRSARWSAVVFHRRWRR